MALELGTTDINRIYLGATDIVKLYLGSSLVFDNSAPPFDPTVFADDDLVGGFVSGFQADNNYGKDSTETGITALVPAGGTGHERATAGDPIRGRYINCAGVRGYQVTTNLSKYTPALGQGFVIDIWFEYTGATTGVQEILSKGNASDSSSNGYQFLILSNGTDLLLRLFSDTGDATTNRMAWGVPLTELNAGRNNVIFGDNGDNNAAGTEAYLNGVLFESYTGGTKAEEGSYTGIDPNGTGNLWVGQRNNNTFYFNGWIDEVLFHKRAINGTLALNKYNFANTTPDVVGLGRPNNGKNQVQGYYRVESATNEIFIADNYLLGAYNMLNTPTQVSVGNTLIQGGILEENSYHRMLVAVFVGSGDPILSVPFDVPANDDDFTQPADEFYHPLPVVIHNPNNDKILAIQVAKHNTYCRIAQSSATLTTIKGYSTEQFRQMSWERLPDIDTVLTAGEGYAYPNARFLPDGKLEIEFRSTAIAVANDFSLARITSNNSTLNGSTTWTHTWWALSDFGSNSLRLYPSAATSFGTNTYIASSADIREGAATNYRAGAIVVRPLSDLTSHRNIAETFTKAVTNTGTDTSSAITYAELTANCLAAGDPTTAATTKPLNVILMNDVVYWSNRDHDNDLDNFLLSRQAIGSGTVTVTTVSLPADFDGAAPSAGGNGCILWGDDANSRVIVRSVNQVSGDTNYIAIADDLTGGWTTLETADIITLPINYPENTSFPISGTIAAGTGVELVPYQPLNAAL